MKKLLLYVIIILTFALIPVFISGGHNWVFTDFVKQQIPFILETKRMFASGHPWWSWNTFAGDNFIGSYCFYTATSPFVWLTCLFPAKWILWGVLLNLYLKTCFTAAFSYLYFRKIGFSTQLCILGGLLYAFSSFYICNLFYFHFCEPIMVFPLLLLTVEMVLNDEKCCYAWLSLAVFCTIFINFYFAFSSLLLACLYFFLRCYDRRKLTSRTLLLTIGSVLLGIGMSAIILLPVVFHMTGGPRISFHYGWQLKPTFFIATIIGHLRSILLPACAEWTFMLQKEFCSMEAYIPIFGILPAIIYCCKHRNWLSRLIIILIFVYFTPFNGIFTCFTNPFYHRWNYGLDLFIIIAALYCVQNSTSITYRDLKRYFIFCACFISLMIGLVITYYTILKIEVAALRHYLILAAEIILFVINSICLYMWVKKRISVNRLILLTAVCGGLNLMLSLTLVTFWEYAYINTDKIFSRNDIVYRDIISAHLEDSPTIMKYRIDYISNFNNIAMQKNMPGIFGFHSIMNKKFVKLRSFTDDIVASPEFKCSRHRESFAALFSVRQVLDYRDSLDNLDKYNSGLNKVASCDTYDTYINANYIPIGFTYSHYVTEEEMMPYIEKKDLLDIPLLLLDNIVINSDNANELSKYITKGNIQTSVHLDSLATARRQTTVYDFIGTSEGFSCKSDFKKPEVVFFSVIADPGFTAYIDNRKTKIYEVNLGLSAIVVPSGKHDILFDYFPKGLKVGAIISACSFFILLTLVFWEKTFAIKWIKR